jgi:hypothetical protein
MPRREAAPARERRKPRTVRPRSRWTRPAGPPAAPRGARAPASSWALGCGRPDRGPHARRPARVTSTSSRWKPARHWYSPTRAGYRRRRRCSACYPSSCGTTPSAQLRSRRARTVSHAPSRGGRPQPDWIAKRPRPRAEDGAVPTGTLGRPRDRPHRRSARNDRPGHAATSDRRDVATPVRGFSSG